MAMAFLLREITPMLKMSKQVALTKTVEPLQIVVPSDFKGFRTDPDASQLYVSTQMATYTFDEIELIKQFVSRLPYKQDLTYGGVLIDPNDPLLSSSHDDLDALEKEAKMPCSRCASSGGEISVYERVLRLRENNYAGTGATALLKAGG